MYLDSEVRFKGRTVGTLRFSTNHNGHTTIDHSVIQDAFRKATRCIEKGLTANGMVHSDNGKNDGPA